MSVRKRGWLRIPLALGLGLLVFVLAGMISTALLGGPPGGAASPPSEFVSTGFVWWETLIGVFLIASTAEEVLARGLVQGLLQPLREARLNLGLTSLSVPVVCGGRTVAHRDSWRTIVPARGEVV